MSKTQSTLEQQVWYIYINEETRGPLGLRDLDVLLRTNQINSRTFCWKAGMKEWKSMNQIEELKQSIFDNSFEFVGIDKKKNGEAPATGADKKKVEGQPDEEHEQDLMIENQDENPLTILEVTVDNLLKKSFHKSEDGKWSIYDEEKEEWVLQDEEPIEQIEKMKNELMSKLKSELFANNDKSRRKNKAQQPTQPLTKEQLERRERNKKKAKRAAEKKKEKWYQARINTFIYISGLPFDITEEQLKQFASRAGVLRIDLTTGKPKIKIYKDENNLPKGDAAVSYSRQESVEIALEMLNDSEIKPGFRVKVQKACFNQKDEEYKRRENKKQAKVKKILAKKNEEKQLTWDDDAEEKGEGFRIVIMKYVFSVEEAQHEHQMQQIKHEITSEVQKIGPLKRIRFFETHPDGVVEIKFQRQADAQACINAMNGRFFDGRAILCEYWDGETDYKLDAKSRELQEERLMKYANQIEDTKHNGVIAEDPGENEDEGQDLKGVDADSVVQFAQEAGQTKNQST